MIKKIYYPFKNRQNLRVRYTHYQRGSGFVNSIRNFLWLKENEIKSDRFKSDI